MMQIYKNQTSDLMHMSKKMSLNYQHKKVGETRKKFREDIKCE